MTHWRKPPDNPQGTLPFAFSNQLAQYIPDPLVRAKEYTAKVTMAAPPCPPWEGPPSADPIPSITELQHVYHLRFPGRLPYWAADCFSNLPGRQFELRVVFLHFLRFGAKLILGRTLCCSDALMVIRELIIHLQDLSKLTDCPWLVKDTKIGHREACSARRKD